MTKDDAVYLNHIRDAIANIEKYTEGIEYVKFEKEQLIQDGVIRQLEIIGEATKKLSKTLKEKHQNIPWKDIAGMRDKLIHDYFGVDLKSVWKTIQEDIPPLKETVTKILKN